MCAGFKSHHQQIELLAGRGMRFENREQATTRLHQISYCRLSEYWYPFFVQDGNRVDKRFEVGATFEDVLDLYDFDARLRSAVFSSLAFIELAVRSLLGYELGQSDSDIHLRPDRLGPEARKGSKPSGDYSEWKKKYFDALERSEEDFIRRHRRAYGSEYKIRIPVWDAVEVLDWGKLTYLYAMAPVRVRDSIADRVELTSAQLHSWMRSLNVVRNIAAHHGRMFNKVYALRPRLPEPGKHPELESIRGVTNRTFGQLTLIQYLLSKLKIGDLSLLPSAVEAFPDIGLDPLKTLGMPKDWQSGYLWQCQR